MDSNDRIQVRISHDVKMLAESKLKRQGLTISDYTRIMIANVAYGGKISINIERPNAELEESIQEAADFVSGKQQLEGYNDAQSLEAGLME